MLETHLLMEMFTPENYFHSNVIKQLGIHTHTTHTPTEVNTHIYTQTDSNTHTYTYPYTQRVNPDIHTPTEIQIHTAHRHTYIHTSRFKHTHLHTHTDRVKHTHHTPKYTESQPQGQFPLFLGQLPPRKITPIGKFSGII